MFSLRLYISSLPLVPNEIIDQLIQEKTRKSTARLLDDLGIPGKIDEATLKGKDDNKLDLKKIDKKNQGN